MTVIDAGPQLRTTGEPLRLSSRLGQAARSGEILFDERSRQLLRDSVLAEPANEGWRLLEVAAGSGTARRLVSPMVGRERERRRLHDAFEQAVGDRSCQLFTVLGLAGVGKSRLVQEFLDGIAGQAVVARGRCLPYGEGITYWPLLEAVNEAVGLEDTDPPDEARAKLLGALGEEPEAELIAHRVAETDRSRRGDAPVRRRALVAVRELFEALARNQPLVLVFDDIHWGEARFLDLVEHLADWVREAPILLVCLARPELLNVRPAWGGGKAQRDRGAARTALGRGVLAVDRESRRPGRVGSRSARENRGGGRRQPALRRRDALDADRRRPARPRGRSLDRCGRYLDGSGAPHDPGPACRPTRPARREANER